MMRFKGKDKVKSWGQDSPNAPALQGRRAKSQNCPTG
ncbi:hypothetical protein SAMN05428953_11819 [Mesorhizobium muleiense]|uniref:Uncharacterized protein n=1 Tax=Mesorhizobium muleiense TaxID=1004279 RepID=A0A1G9DHN1_9HYPH|nr:hypothetical protein SAMN05428953_11819 [Mesorhizobium muleiense]